MLSYKVKLSYDLSYVFKDLIIIIIIMLSIKIKCKVD